ncbi:17997_t:CDS:2, partial [Racocetra fulgida]
GDRPDHREARKWKNEYKSVEGVGRSSVHFHDLKIIDSSVVGVGLNNATFDMSEKLKKRKQEDQEENTRKNIKIDDLSMSYEKLIKEINTARENEKACLTVYVLTRLLAFLNPSLNIITVLYSPLCWGIVDLRAKNISPCPNHPRAGEFLSNAEVQKLQQMCTEIINKESQLNPSALTLLEVLQSKTFSLKKFSREKRARGIKGICSLLHIKIDIVDIYDKDTQYIGECLDAL